MTQQLALSQRLFQCGLLVMLGTGILSATVWTDGGAALQIMMVGGAGLTIAARIWQGRLRRLIHRSRTCPGLGGYPLERLTRARTSNRSRSAA
ncbi:MAG: hypothetical protein GXY44_11890 [Phycisphaerales bacterium]|nr:hypothetical protein [Phycisphaerales bacterium]